MKISKRGKTILAALTGVILSLGFLYLLFFIFIYDPVYSYFTAQKYQAVLNGKWNTYNNQALNISFEYPDAWQVREGDVSFCKSGKGLWISPKSPEDFPRSNLGLCKAPNIDNSRSIENELDNIEKIKTPYKTFYSSKFSKTSGATFVRDVIAEDKSVTMDIQVPYPSDQGPWIVEERDKIILRLLKSIRDSK